ncbi:POLLENLESS 3-like protein [Drosera capensis]
MWISDKNFTTPEQTPRGFSTPPPWRSQPLPCSWNSEKKRPTPPLPPPPSPQQQMRSDCFHVIHKVPAGDSPYVKAKHVQLIDKDPGRAISLFWAAINSGDRVDSALKDMAVVMKQLDRSDEAIEAIRSFRHLCSPDSQESLDNVLVELYKRSGRLEEQIEILQLKLKRVEEGSAFAGRKTKIARSQGKKVHITVEQEYARLLGNLAWAYLQQNNYEAAEEYYRKALSIEIDRNKQCNLAVCLLHMNKVMEARLLIQVIKASAGDRPMDESCLKSFERATQLLAEIESQTSRKDKETQNQNQGPFAPTDKGRIYTPPVVVPWRAEPRAAFFTQPKTTDRNAACAAKVGSGPSRKLQFPYPSVADSVRAQSSNVGSVKPPLAKRPAEISSVCMVTDHKDRPCTTHEESWKCPSWDKNEPKEDSMVFPIAKEDGSRHEKPVSAASDSATQQPASSVVQVIPTNKQKKSWADMVEEEEEEEMFNVAFTNHSVKSPEPLSQKFKSFELDGRGSVTGGARFAAIKPPSAARRSLCFGQAETVVDNKEPTRDGSKGNRWGNANSTASSWRNRLPVFRGITMLPVSPQA